MWWPSPEALKDLEIQESEDGFQFSAPPDSECGVWLSHFAQSEELREVFEAEINNCLLSYLLEKESDGKAQVQSNQ